MTAAGIRWRAARSGDDLAAAPGYDPGMTIAALPMYDWPEVAAATDALWAAIRDRLRAEGVPAPEVLTRDRGLVETWTSPDLTLGQTCGLPLVEILGGRVVVVGALDYGLPDCPPGWYRSAVVARADDPRTTLADFRGAALAINGSDSQSGWGSIRHHAAPLAEAGRFFGAVHVTGAHAASISAVATGTADIAAIDAVSLRLAQRFRPEAARLKTLFLTDPTPGLPLIAALGTDLAAHRRALAAAITGLDTETRAALGIRGFVPLDAETWAVVAARLAAARDILQDAPA